MAGKQNLSKDDLLMLSKFAVPSKSRESRERCHVLDPWQASPAAHVAAFALAQAQLTISPLVLRCWSEARLIVQSRWYALESAPHPSLRRHVRHMFQVGDLINP